MVEKISSWTISLGVYLFVFVKLKKHVHNFYASQTSLISLIRFRYLVVFRIIYMFPFGRQKKNVHCFTRRDYHLKRSMFLVSALRKHHYFSLHIYNYAFALFIHF